MIHVMLFPMLNVLHFHSRSFLSTSAVPNWAFLRGGGGGGGCSSLTSCFSGMLLNDFEIVSVAHIITGITFSCSFLYTDSTIP